MTDRMAQKNARMGLVYGNARLGEITGEITRESRWAWFKFFVRAILDGKCSVTITRDRPAPRRRRLKGRRVQ